MCVFRLRPHASDHLDLFEHAQHCLYLDCCIARQIAVLKFEKSLPLV